MIFGQGKTAEQIERILGTLVRHGQGGLVTRVDPNDGRAILNVPFPKVNGMTWDAPFEFRSPIDPGPKLARWWW